MEREILRICYTAFLSSKNSTHAYIDFPTVLGFQLQDASQANFGSVSSWPIILFNLMPQDPIWISLSIQIPWCPNLS